MIFELPFVKRFALCYRTVVCLSCLSVTLVYCGRADQGETWHGGRPRLWPHCVRWGPNSPAQRGTAPNFGPCLLWPNGCMDQDATGYGGKPRPKPYCVTRWPSSPKKGTTAPSVAKPIVAKRSPISATAEHLSTKDTCWRMIRKNVTMTYRSDLTAKLRRYVLEMLMQFRLNILNDSRILLEVIRATFYAAIFITNQSWYRNNKREKNTE